MNGEFSTVEVVGSNVFFCQTDCKMDWTVALGEFASIEFPSNLGVLKVIAQNHDCARGTSGACRAEKVVHTVTLNADSQLCTHPFSYECVSTLQLPKGWYRLEYDYPRDFTRGASSTSEYPWAYLQIDAKFSPSR